MKPAISPLTGSGRRQHSFTTCPDKNDHFTEIGKSLLTTNKACFNASVIEAFCRNTSNSSQFFIPQISADDIVNRILKLQNKTSCGLDGIRPQILKLSAPFVECLTYYAIYAWISLTFQLLLSTLKLFPYTKRVISMTSTISDQCCCFQPSQNRFNVKDTHTGNHIQRKKICISVCRQEKIILVKLLYSESGVHGIWILTMPSWRILPAWIPHPIL